MSLFDDDFYDDADSPWEHAAEVGAGYALFRHGQDRQTATLVSEIRRLSGDGDEYQPRDVNVTVHLTDEDEPTNVPAPNVLDFTTVDMPSGWDDYIGQEPLKRRIAVAMASAKKRGERMPHTLFASGMPGVGKTTAARLVAVTMGVNIIELVPPFNVYALVEAVLKLEDGDICFIDEIHKLADAGKRGAEFLLKVLEEGVAFLPDGSVVKLPNVTYIGATTDKDMLPEPVIDRFKLVPYFQAYSIEELARIAMQFTYRHQAQDAVDPTLAAHIALACRNTPRIIEQMVEAARDLTDAFGQPPQAAELLEYLEVEPDGLTRTHIHYLTAMRQYFARETKDGEIEYIVGEAAIQQILRETKQGIGRVERFLVERGLVDRTPRGRRLTEKGIARAEEFIATGKGAADVA